MDTFLHDLRYSLRNLAKNPGFTLIALLTLSLGIGANTAIFSVVNAALIRSLPYADPDRLVVILHNGRNPASHGNFFDWKSDNHVFANMGAAEAWSPNLTGVDKPEELIGLHVTSEIFPTLGVQPMIGRSFLPEEDQPGKDHEVILSYQLWQQRFAGNRNALGRTMQLNGEPYTIVGVMPQGFRFAPFWATKAQLWSPLQLDPANRGGFSLRIFARLKPGVSLEQAERRWQRSAHALKRNSPAPIKTW